MTKLNFPFGFIHIFRRSLRVRLTVILLLLTLIPLIVVSGVGIWQTRRTLEERALREVLLTTDLDVQEVQTFLAQFEADLFSVSQTPPIQGIIRARDNQGIDPIDNDSYETWVGRLNQIFVPLAESKQFYQQIRYLDENGQELVRVDFDGQNPKIVADQALQNKSDRPYFQDTMKLSAGEVYISALDLNQEQGKIQVPFVPVIRYATPVFDLAGNRKGIVILNIYADTFLTRLDREDRQTYLANEAGFYLHHPDPDREFGFDLGTDFKVQQDFATAMTQLGSDDTFIGLDTASDKVVALERIYFDLSQPQRYWLVISALPRGEVFADVNTLTYVVAGVVGAVAVLIVIVAFFTVRNILEPINQLARASERMTAGELVVSLPIVREDEIGLLATAFTYMAGQIQDLVGSLEQKVSDRTQRLEIAATLAERLSAVLQVEQVLITAVNQIKENFDYYHTHIYLLDEKREYLIMAEGTGQAGAEMKAKGHRIALTAATSLVARAARSGQIVRVDNVREAVDWLPNALLPDTYSEIAIPIILEGRVMGVLDVQEDEIAGLDESDASVLRSVANQVAVAIRNAGLFAEVEAALAEARVAQDRYTQEVWTQVRQVRQGAEYYHSQAGVPSLNQSLLTELEQKGGEYQQRPAIVKVSYENEQENAAVVAPIHLQNQLIGMIQLHQAESEHGHSWSERDLALIEVVATQVAQTAENLRLFDETREQASQERIVREITEKLRQAPDLETLAQVMGREIGNVLEADEGLVSFGIHPNGN